MADSWAAKFPGKGRAVDSPWLPPISGMLSEKQQTFANMWGRGRKLKKRKGASRARQEDDEALVEALPEGPDYWSSSPS